MSRTDPADAFVVERHGEVVAVRTSRAIETLDPSHLEGAAALLLDALGREPSPQVVVDLSPLNYFGSSFLALLIRCWKVVQARGGTMVISGVSETTRSLLHMTSLDMVWPIYDDLFEAIESLQSD